MLVRGEQTRVEATGGNYAAGIGGGDSGGWGDDPGTAYTGTVTIEGGTVIAQGGGNGAGIGGGNAKGAKAPAANYKGARQTFSRSFHAS